jgi:hypothetical protein
MISPVSLRGVSLLFANRFRERNGQAIRIDSYSSTWQEASLLQA